MEYLPSKKFLTRVLALFLALGGWFFFSGNNFIANSEINNKNIGIVEKRDGTLVFSKNQEKESLFAGLSASDDWSLENNNQEETQYLINKLATDKNEEIIKESSLFDFKPYKKNDLNIITIENESVLQKYANDLASALKPYSLKGLPNEGFLAMQAIETNNFEDFKKIEVMGQIHKVVTETLLKMQVPNELSTRHLDLINSSAKISHIDSKLAKNYDNPGTILFNANEFKKSSEELVFSIENINLFFAKKEIGFGPDKQIDIYINLIR